MMRGGDALPTFASPPVTDIASTSQINPMLQIWVDRGLSDADSNRDADGYAYGNTDRNTDGHAYGNTDRDANCDADGYAYGNTDRDTNPHPDADSYPDAVANAYSAAGLFIGPETGQPSGLRLSISMDCWKER